METTPGHRLALAQYDPVTVEERLVWYVGRALDWLMAASNDELVKIGDPFELPYYPVTRYPETTIAFSEGPATFQAWSRVQVRSGLVDLVEIKNRPGELFAARAFRTPSGKDLVRPHWGSVVERLPDSGVDVWLRLDGVPFVYPWRAPETFGELRAIARGQKFNLDSALRPVIGKLREGGPHHLLLAFPMPVRRGDPPSLVHWLALRVGGTKAPGAATSNDGGALADDAPLVWLNSANWHPDQLLSRGRFERGLKDRSVVVLGCGALGAAIAELLVRGGIERIVVIDHEVLEAGNLVRHTLQVDDIGWPKAMALADRLNQISPNATAIGVFAGFPNVEDDVADAIRSAGLIIDTTGDDAVADAMADFDWGTDQREFASVSFSYGAERLYSFASIGTTFPSASFGNAVRPWVDADKRLTEELVWEGAGCRYPVFPARADDVNALAALAVRDLDERLLGHGAAGLRVFGRARNGTISELAEPASQAE